MLDCCPVCFGRLWRADTGLAACPRCGWMNKMEVMMGKRDAWEKSMASRQANATCDEREGYVAARMCPRCGEDSYVYKTREQADGSILRYRKCGKCKKKFETIELLRK